VTVITLDGDQNSINGAACIDTFEMALDSPNSPTWASNNGLAITFTDPPIGDTGTYDIQYLVTETGTGPCNFIPHNRRLTVVVTKRPPVINYNIPDYLDQRASMAYDISFPQPICTDPHNQPLTYNFMDQNDIALSPIFNLDSTGNGRIFGTVPNSQAGTYFLR